MAAYEASVKLGSCFDQLVRLTLPLRRPKRSTLMGVTHTDLLAITVFRHLIIVKVSFLAGRIAVAKRSRPLCGPSKNPTMHYIIMII